MLGGIKDKRHAENPKACVECGNIAPLNKCHVCEECFNNSPAAEAGEEWEE